ncbi:MAG: hypothetical protein PHY79_18615 [Anaerolineae bacterium]|jgi:hypothetical protein|nr:hypothetical protein [Anaerolineae bacterium]
MKKLSILVIVALLSTLFVLPASAQSLTWTSGFQVQNLSPTTAASIFIYYYNQDGTEAIPPVSDTIPAMSSKTYFPIHAADGFNGSVVVESTEPVVAIANTIGTGADNYKYWATTESFSAGATSLGLPLIMRANSGFSTWFNVQNAGSTDATVQVEYIPGSSGNAYNEPAVVIKPGASHTYQQAGLTALGDKFVGSAVITSDVPVVATVMQVGAKTMLGYNGFAVGSTTVSLPLVMANNNGFFTGIQVQNVGASPTDITVDFGANIAGAFNPANETAALGPGESHTFLQNTGQFAADKYVGSATITTTGQPVVAIVNQLKGGTAPRGTAYDGFDPDAATTSVSAPLVMSNNNGYFTGIQVMNVGSTPVDITIDYGPNTVAGSTFNPVNETATIQPGNSYNSLQNTGQFAVERYIGSATVTGAAGSQIVMIVNQIKGGTAGDTFMTYNGFNY